MLRAHLLEGPSSKAWVDKVPRIMLTLNAMPHEPHGFSASMIATGCKPTLPPDLHPDTNPSLSAEDPATYVEIIQKRLQLTHQQMATPPPSPAAIPYQVGSLIFALTTPPECTSKLAPRWKGPYLVCRIPNEYQVVYEDGNVERTIHINHAKPAKFTAPDLLEPVSPTETPRPPLGYLPVGLARRPAEPRALPADTSVAPAPPPAPPAAPAENAMPPPASIPANQQPEFAPPRWRSPRLNPVQGHVHAIKRSPVTQPHHSSKRSKMARTYPLTASYNECLGRKVNPLSFASLRLIGLRNGHSQYLSTIEQLVEALPKSMDPASRFALQGHIACPVQTRLRHSMRAAIGFLLPFDGAFHRSSSSLQYFLTRQGRCVVLLGGDVTPPPWECHLNWVHEDHPPPSRDHGKENLPPPEEPRKLPRKMRPSRKPRKHHHHHLSQTGGKPGTIQSPSSAMSTPVKRPQTFQRPQHPQPPGSAANHNSERPNLLDQAELGRLYKPARSSISKESTTRSRRDNFSGSNLSFTGLQRSHRDYFSGSPSGQLNKKVSLTDTL